MNLNAVSDIVRSKQSLEACTPEEHEGRILRVAHNKDSLHEFDFIEEKSWGWFSFRPRCLQWLNTSRWMLTIVCFVTIFQGMDYYFYKG